MTAEIARLEDAEYQVVRKINSVLVPTALVRNSPYNDPYSFGFVFPTGGPKIKVAEKAHYAA
jgi:hypothetical protein